MSTATAPLALLKCLPDAATGRRVAWLCSLSFSLALLLAPALWNGFAIVFYDTGGYIGRVLDMTLAPGRSFFYGLFMWLTSFGWWSFWGPVTVQSLAVIWLIRLVLRCHGLAAGPFATAAFTAGLSLATGISWYSGQLMPDVFVPLTVLSLWLLGFAWRALTPAERVPLVATALLGMLAHMSCLALGVGLALALVVARLCGKRWRRLPPLAVAPPLATVMAAVILMPMLHFLLFGKFGYTPGGPVFIFGRLVQDGIAQKYLAEHCPIDGIKLCGLQQRLPKTADEFLWDGGSPFKAIGDWDGAKTELGRLVRECFKTYPGQAAWSSLVFAAQQLVEVGTGDGLDAFHDHARGVFARLGQPVAGQYVAARQQQAQLTKDLFHILNQVHVPVALLSTLGLSLLIGWGVTQKQEDIAGLSAFILISLLGNAFICGALSNPHHRYQSRLVWVATLVVMMAAVRWYRLRRGRARQ